MYTVGMKQFGLMDIEVERTMQTLEDTLALMVDVASYLAISGPVIADGDTFGLTNEQRIRVRHQNSIVDPTRLVYKLEM